VLFWQLVVDGLGRGAIYAGLGLSLVLVFRCTGLINFAQGELATLSTYLTFGLTVVGLNVWLALALSMVVSAAVAALVEVSVVRPVLKRPHVVVVIMTIGLYIVANAISQYVGGPNPRRMPQMFPAGTWTVFGVRITAALIGVLLVEALVVTALWLFFTRTQVGLAFRAVATSPRESEYVGIRVQRILMVGWALAAALGALAGALLTNIGFYLQPDMMSGVLVFALAAVTIGGFESAGGTVVAGLLLGVAEALITTYVPGLASDFGIVVALGLVLAVLLLRPQGLGGRLTVVRV
jgi:branched-chain amino acid transport system permease protein